ncbi:glycerophosphodiester phosphodiesterase [Streptomyces bohaiensis]|uniref:Glycerophosphodiester phosphodiesterase n=1 Tax=Streptomyces bohaiensis TaxID=1431344 RepID=A0ABX1C3W2_9ACTN|nr:glycerophosphodiester phosphodiesterase [Streptomyces bohaiensis]
MATHPGTDVTAPAAWTEPRPVLAIAHRGDPFHHPENTLPSFRSALDAGADAVELDVRLTRDGVPVVLHDAGLKRVWGHDCPLRELTLAEVTELCGGSVPTLRQALASTFPKLTLVDLPEPDGRLAREVVATVREDGSMGRVRYCGDPAALRAVREHDSAADIALTWKLPTPIRRSLLADIAPTWLNLRFGLIDRRLVERAHERGYLVGAWTADTRRTMRRLIGLGVDAVTSNRVAVLREEIDRTGDGAAPRPPL